MDSFAPRTLDIVTRVQQPPAATPPPVPRLRKFIKKRQDEEEEGEESSATDETTAEEEEETEESTTVEEVEEPDLSTCAILNFTDGQLIVPCDGDCYTSSLFFGCEEYFYTTCYDIDHASCGENGPQESCCMDEAYPYCATIYKSDNGDRYTQFECFSEIQGEFTAEPAGVVVTETITSIHTPPPASSSEAETSSTGSAAEESAADDSGPSGPPVGAIVGGAVGGLALIALVVFGVWYMRIQKRKAGSTTAVGSGSMPYPMSESGQGSEYPGEIIYYDNLQMNAPSPPFEPSYSPSSPMSHMVVSPSKHPVELQ